MSLIVGIFLGLFVCGCMGIDIQPWGNAWTMTEWQYYNLVKNATSKGFEYDKRINYWFYDYNKKSMRNDGWVVRGIRTNNITSVWIHEILYIIHPDDHSCITTHLGFGIPRPFWFLDANFTEYIYLLKSRDDKVTRTVHLQKESPGMWLYLLFIK